MSGRGLRRPHLRMNMEHPVKENGSKIILLVKIDEIYNKL